MRALLGGGIGSGKSAVAALLRKLGAVVIDADMAGHRVLEPGGEAFDQVAARWPEVVRAGRVDRGALGAVVFADPAQLAELEAITHPAIAARIAAAVVAADAEVVVVEVPVLANLVGEGWPRLVVDAPDAARVARSVARGMDEADVRRRMASQPGREEWLAAADYVVDNSGTWEDLAAEVDRLWAWLTGRRDTGNP